MTALITGANRGIGLELVRQLVSRGDSVIAVARQPESSKELLALKEQHSRLLEIQTADVADGGSVKSLARALEGKPIDGLINNAGTSAPSSLGTLDFDAIRRVFETNTLGPLRVTEALLPNLKLGRGKRVLHITSLMGSISDASGGSYAYRISKAALNMAGHLLAFDLRGDGIISVLAHPGWVQTDMGGAHAPVPVAESARGLLALFDGLSLEKSGRFFNYDGRELPW